LYNASLSLDVHLIRTGGSNNFSLSYGGLKRGGGFEIACARLSSEMADTLYNASLSLVDVHILGKGGSNNFSLSYGGSKSGGRC
jgi:hypothetical protein